MPEGNNSEAAGAVEVSEESFQTNGSTATRSGAEKGEPGTACQNGSIAARLRAASRAAMAHHRVMGNNAFSYGTPSVAGAYSAAPGGDVVRQHKTEAYRRRQARCDSEQIDTAPEQNEIGEASSEDNNDVEQQLAGVIQQDPSAMTTWEGARHQEQDARELSEALPVSDGQGTTGIVTHNQQFGVATPLSPRDHEKGSEARGRNSLPRCAGGLLIAMILLVIGISVLVSFLVLSSYEQEKAPEEAPADIQVITTKPPTPLVPGLPEYSIEAILQDAASPQARANDWILQDPNIATYDPVRLFQRYAIATLFYATTQSNSRWKHDENWLSYDHHECDWYTNKHFTYVEGTVDLTITLEEPCTPEGLYHTIWLSDNGLVGTLPLEFFGLGGQIVSINLKGNAGLRGSIPSQIGLLTNLGGLSVTGLTGTLPTELGLLPKFVNFDGSSNSFSGTLPTELATMSSLQRLIANDSRFTGTIPTEIGLVSTLTTLKLGGSKLSGSIPLELTKLSQLRYLMLNDNQLTGTIHREFGAFSSAYALYLNDNRLTGSLPPELGGMLQVREASFAGNELTGTLPAQLGLWKHVYGLALQDNRFTGSIPIEWDQLMQNGSLETLDLSGNLLQGTIPGGLCALNESLSLDSSESLDGCDRSLTGSK